MSRPKTRGRPFPKGKSGNPGGRPVNSGCLSVCLREVASQPAGAGLTHAQKLARVLWRKAEAGDVRAAALIADRMEGRPGQRAEKVYLAASGGPTDIHYDYRIVSPLDDLPAQQQAGAGPTDIHCDYRIVSPL